MTVADLIDLLMRHGSGADEVILFYGHSELLIDSIDPGTRQIILTLDEKRDYSDPEKHEG